MASVLNPDHHPRIWHREGRSLEKAGYRVHYFSGSTPFRKDLFFRVLQPFRLLKQVLGIRPKFLHIHTPELAWAALMGKWLLGYRLIYDRHEAYPVQIRYGRSWIAGLFLGKMAGWMERLLYRYAEGIVLAEEGYQQSAPARAVLVRNSYLPIPLPPPENTEPYLLISGALSERNGIRKSIELWQKLRKTTPWKLHIVGHCQEPELKHFLMNLSRQDADIILVGITEPVDYVQILKEIQGCVCGLALFEPSIHLSGKTPARVYEFIGLHRRLIMSGNPEWAKQFPPNIRYWDKQGETSDLASWILSPVPEDLNTEHWTWESDENRLLKLYTELA